MAQTIYLGASATQRDIIAAIDSLTAGGTIVFAKDSTIELTSTLRLKVDTQKITLDLNGSTLKMGHLVVGIEASGTTKPLAGVKLASDANGNATITYDKLPADIAVGRWVKVVADDDLPGDHIDPGDNGNTTKLGQAAKIIAIDGNTVTLQGGLIEQPLYQTNVRAGLYSSGSVEIKNGAMEGPGDGIGPRLIRISSLVEASVEDMRFTNASEGVTVVNSVSTHLTDVSAINVYGGIQSATSFGTTINGLFAENVDHGVIIHATGTVTNSASIYNYGADIGMKATNAVVYDASRAAFDFHSESRYGIYSESLAFDSRMFGDLRGIGNSFVDSGGVGNSYGIQFFEYGEGDGRDATVANMTLRETEKYSFIKSGNTLNNTVENSSFESYGRGYGINSAAVAITDTIIKEAVSGVDDVLNGTAQADKLLGGKGNDILNGFDGDDYLWGGTGVDILTGGAGRDRFAYHALDEGGDIITDFTAGAGGDILDVSVLGIRLGWGQGDLLQQGLLRAIQSGANTIVQANDGQGGWVTLATMENVVAAQLTAANVQTRLSDPMLSSYDAALAALNAKNAQTAFAAPLGDTLIFAGAAGAKAQTVWNFGKHDNVGLIRDAFLGLDSNGDGKLDNGTFAYNNATASHAQLIYNQSTGGLYYDADGTGDAQAQLIVNLPGARATFDSSDILLL